MNAAEIILSAFTFLLTIASGLVAWTFSSTKGEHDRRLNSLEGQNAAQERELATLRANTAAHDGGLERLEQTMQRMDSKIDQLMLAIGRRPTPYGSGGAR